MPSSICVGILAASGKQTFDALHAKGPRAIAKAAREAGCERLIHISAIGANPKSPSNYARSKAEGERAVLEEFPSAVILRPSIMFGPEDEFFNRFASLAQLAPLMPLIGGGRSRFQPVFVGDVATAIANVLGGAGTPGTVYELGGPEIATFRKLLDLTQQWSGRDHRYFPIPFWLAKLQAILTWPLPQCAAPTDPRSGSHAPGRQCHQPGRPTGRPHTRVPRRRSASGNRRGRSLLSRTFPPEGPVFPTTGVDARENVTGGCI